MLVAVLGGVLVLVPVLLCVCSGRIVTGECGPWAQKNLTHHNPNVPILFAGNKWPSGIQGEPEPPRDRV